VAAIGVLAVLGAGCQPSSTTPVAERTTASASPTAEPTFTTLSVPTTAPAPTQPTTDQVIKAARPKTALAVLGTLAVKGRSPLTGYARDQFGAAWTDTDRNGCDTRNDILNRDLVAKTWKAGTHGCVVTSGDLAPDPYTATRIHFVRGGASEVDIDHVVALANAWVTGAQYWPYRKRLALANDPLNLLAVDSGANRQKGDGDAATWLPANKRYRCAYVARQVGVKAKYGLWVTRAERDAIARVLSSCPSQPAPTGGNPTSAPVSGSTTTTTTTTTTTSTSGLDPRFGTCTEAKAHGYGPYYQGKDPEYDWYTDRDHDGVVCE
jgi:hypothetical protein